MHTPQASHISHMNLPTYNIRATAQWENVQKNEIDAGSGIMQHLEDFPIIPFENFNTYNSPYIFPERNLTFSK